MKDEIKRNIVICKLIKKELNILGKSKVNRPDIFVLIDELTTKTDWLKELYKQIIP